MASRIKGDGEQLIQGLGSQLESVLSGTLEASLKRQEEFVGELNRITSDKWDKLFSATAASQGMGRIR
ncbi:hypothetical protein D3C72_2421300 [compost metagenome]